MLLNLSFYNSLVSHEQVSSLDGICALKNLQVLFMSNNKIKNWAEVGKLQVLSNLIEVNFVNNPIGAGKSHTIIYQLM